MRVLVISDTHGNIEPSCRAIELEKPDCIIHLGDHDRDAAEIRSRYPEIPMHNVCGNCDWTPLAPTTLTVQLGPVKAFLTHGHMHGVRTGVDRLVYASMEAGANIAMYGHTHMPDNTTVGGTQVLNPGTAGSGRYLSYAIVTIFDNGGIACEIKDL